jgi:hypothetical protein
MANGECSIVRESKGLNIKYRPLNSSRVLRAMNQPVQLTARRTKPPATAPLSTATGSQHPDRTAP